MLEVIKEKYVETNIIIFLKLKIFNNNIFIISQFNEVFNPKDLTHLTLSFVWPISFEI